VNNNNNNNNNSSDEVHEGQRVARKAALSKQRGWGEREMSE
jgi:hypothetical protein